MATPLSVPFSEVSDLTGAIGLGSINMLSLFLILDAVSPVFLLIEANAGTNSWALFVTIPLLVTSYVVGVIVTAMGTVLRSALGIRRKINVAFIVGLDGTAGEFVKSEYRQFFRKREMLEGAFPTFLILLVGIMFDALAYDLLIIGVVIGACCAIAASLCLVFVSWHERDFEDFVERMNSL